MWKQVHPSPIPWIETCGIFPTKPGFLEDPWFDPTTPENREMYKLHVDPELAPDEAQYIELNFDKGNCVAIDGNSSPFSGDSYHSIRLLESTELDG